MSQKYKTVRVVVEVRVPQHVTAKRLVWKLKELLKWPIQLGHEGDHTTLVRPQFKEYGRVQSSERVKEAKLFRHRERGQEFNA